MIESRVPMSSEIVQVLFAISSCALPSHTSVPCERPEICKKSENSFGFASSSMPIVKPVPISGMPSEPVLQKISSSVTPSTEQSVHI